MERHKVEIDETLAARLAHVRKREHIRGLRKREWVFLSIFLILALGAFFNFKRVVVHGYSMEPSFHDGQSVIVWTRAPAEKLRIGDVIVFRQGSDELIKRIIFIQNLGRTTKPPGWVWTPQGKMRFMDLFSGYTARQYMGLASAPPPQNTIYVLGDNVSHSDDSRDFGPINPDQILGKVIQ